VKGLPIDMSDERLMMHMQMKLMWIICLLVKVSLHL